jgi:hypothetical protein
MNEEAKRYLEESRKHLEECKMINDTLEGILETSPKPSTMLDYTFQGLGVASC